MQRYFVDKNENNNFIIINDDFHHIKNVMRMNDKDNIEVVYNEKLYICSIEIKEESVIASIIEELNNDYNNIEITIVQGLPKGDKFDFIIQKATELGVTKIIPLNCNRSIVKYDKDKEKKKIDRWQKIAKEASEQSKRITIPVIDKITDINNLKDLDYDIKLLCSVNEKEINIKHHLQNIKYNDKIIIVVGPEGGFTDNEEETLIKYGFKRVSLGENILRTETAPIFIVSVIKYELMR